MPEGGVVVLLLLFLLPVNVKLIKSRHHDRANRARGTTRSDRLNNVRPSSLLADSLLAS